MNLQVKVLLVSFISTIVLSNIMIPILKKLKVGQNEREDGPKSHFKKAGTPTMGGVIIIVSAIIGAIVGTTLLSETNQEISKRITPLLLPIVGFGLIGFVDDFTKLKGKNTKGISPIFKILGLLIIAVSYVLYLIYGLQMGTSTYIPILKTYIEIPIWLYIPAIVFVLVGAPNAVNLTDGIDGLASGITTILIACITVISIVFNVPELSVMGSVITGSCIGFLLFNMHPASVFMGDTGSLALGGAIAVMITYLKMPLLLGIIFIVPIVETISVMIQVVYFKKTGNRIFKMAPIHHHLELSGWSENKVVSFATFVTIVVCIIGVLVV